METKKLSRKGMEMTMPLLITIVIGLVILMVVIYIMWTRSQTFGESTGCSPEDCMTAGEQCADSKEPGFIACSEKGSDGKKKVGRCCVAVES
jgi:hypothetical protein